MLARSTLVPALLLALLLAAPAPAVELREEIDEAIDLGSVWLAMQQRPDGSWPGYDTSYPMGPTALALLTLRTCGFPGRSAVIEKGFRELRRRYEELKPGGRLKTYSIALTMMALEEHHAPPPEAPPRPSRYGPGNDERRVRLPPRDLAWMREMTEWMVDHQWHRKGGAYDGGIWRYPSGGYDHSNTQYALLGLKAARRCGIPVSAQVFLESMRHFIDVQESTGPEVEQTVTIPGADEKDYVEKRRARARGWGYRAGDRATGSMTAGAVGSLAICRSELMGKNVWSRRTAVACEEAIADGLAWLGHNFSVSRNPGRAGQHYYYLYALERAGILCDVKRMGEHDWYLEGARYLVRAQGEEGSWEGGGGRRGRGDRAALRGGSDGVQTCFALLFLKRGTVPVTLPAVTPR